MKLTEKISPSVSMNMVQLSICQHTVEWKVIFSNDNNTFDVIPILDSFNSIECDPYKPIEDAFKLPTPVSLREVVNVLVKSLLESQSTQLKQLHDNR